ncbi:hypothetical protein I79_003462 [Cricetulus griseus]|uniref:Uncharacterized protein n=1 Tax=Cricetulus griseus TaxID=10029 RepID=G3H014_CRIGR|nr:hypothetical protein I79_003462 [Cricetulus griseus]
MVQGRRRDCFHGCFHSIPTPGLLSLPGISVKTWDQRVPLWKELSKAHATCEPFCLRCSQNPWFNHSLAVVGIYADLASHQAANISEILIWEGEEGVERLGTSVSQRNLCSKSSQKTRHSPISRKAQGRSETGPQAFGENLVVFRRQHKFSERKSFHANLISCFDELHQHRRLGECPESVSYFQ